MTHLATLTGGPEEIRRSLGMPAEDPPRRLIVDSAAWTGRHPRLATPWPWRAELMWVPRGQRMAPGEAFRAYGFSAGFDPCHAGDALIFYWGTRQAILLWRPSFRVFA